MAASKGATYTCTSMTLRHTFALVVLVGCVGVSPAPTPDPERRAVILTSAPPSMILSRETGTLESETPRLVELAVTAPPAVAWTVAKGVYEKLGIPVTVMDVPSRRLGNANFWKARMVGEWSMGELVDCGSGVRGRKADGYRIYMSLLTMVDRDASVGTVLRTTLVAFAEQVAGPGNDRAACRSTGVLETLINESIRDNLPKP
jgi:hypothetical protein